MVTTMARKNGLGLVWCVICITPISVTTGVIILLLQYYASDFVLFAVCRIGDAPGNDSLMRVQGEFDEQGRRHVFYIVGGSLRFPNPLKKIFKIFKLSSVKFSNFPVSNFQNFQTFQVHTQTFQYPDQIFQHRHKHNTNQMSLSNTWIAVLPGSWSLYGHDHNQTKIKTTHKIC